MTATAAGSYTCTAINWGGSGTSSVAKLVVLLLPMLNATLPGGELVLTWTNNGASSEEATNVTGPWFTNSTAASPWQENPSEPQMFYRVPAK